MEKKTKKRGQPDGLNAAAIWLLDRIVKQQRLAPRPYQNNYRNQQGRGFRKFNNYSPKVNYYNPWFNRQNRGPRKINNNRGYNPKT